MRGLDISLVEKIRVNIMLPELFQVFAQKPSTPNVSRNVLAQTPTPHF